jgi:cytoskeletal protein RodZ
MKRNQRYETRLEKRKQNRFLNIAIGLVFLLIVVVAFNLFSGDENETASTSENNQTESSNETKDDSAIEMESDKEENTDASEESDKEETETNEEEEAQSESPEGGGPEGPWEPIGTSQTEPHQKSYDDQSQDWKEMVQALSYATNIPEDEMTIFWLGNGGGPELSKGTVQSKVEKVKYDVELQWIPEKGWQPISVTPVQ